MPIVVSNKIQELIQQKMDKGCRSKLRKICTKYAKTMKYAHSDFIAGIELGLEVSGSGKEIVVAVYECKECFVFDLSGKTEQEWVEIIENERPGPKKPTPEKVMAKMALLRIQKLMKYAEWVTSRKGFPRVSKETIQKTTPIRTISSMKELCQCSNIGMHYKKLETEINEFLERNEVTDQVISEAWDLYSVAKIQEVLNGGTEFLHLQKKNFAIGAWKKPSFLVLSSI